MGKTSQLDYVSMLSRLNVPSRIEYLTQALNGFVDSSGQRIKDRDGREVPGLERRYMEIFQDWRVTTDITNQLENQCKELPADPPNLGEDAIGPKEQLRRTWQFSASQSGQLEAQLAAVYQEIDRIKTELEKLDPR